MHAHIVLMALMQILYWISKLVIEWQEVYALQRL